MKLVLFLSRKKETRTVNKNSVNEKKLKYLPFASLKRSRLTFTISMIRKHIASASAHQLPQTMQ